MTPLPCTTVVAILVSLKSSELLLRPSADQESTLKSMLQINTLLPVYPKQVKGLTSLPPGHPRRNISASTPSQHTVSLTSTITEVVQANAANPESKALNVHIVHQHVMVKSRIFPAPSLFVYTCLYLRRILKTILFLYDSHTKHK